MDRGILQFKVDNETWIQSLQHGFLHVLTHTIQHPFSLNYYAVYSSLRRLGFIVKRHKPELYKIEVVTAVSKMNKHQHRSRRNRKQFEQNAPLPIIEIVNKQQLDQKREVIKIQDGGPSPCYLPLVQDSLIAKELKPFHGMEIELKTLFETLQVIKQDLVVPQVNKDEQEDEQLVQYMVFDVWRSSEFEKSAKKPQHRPSFTVFVVNVSDNDTLPLDLLSKLQSRTQPTPLYIAAVNAASVSYMQMECGFEIQNAFE